MSSLCSSPATASHTSFPAFQTAESSFSTFTDVSLFLPEIESAESAHMSSELQNTVPTKPSQISSLSFNTFSVGLAHMSPKSMKYISNTPQTVIQPNSHPALNTPQRLESFPDSKAEVGSQASQHSSPIIRRLAILSHLRHLAAGRSHILDTFEEQTRELFRRMNVPSPECRQVHHNPEPTSPEQPAAETEVSFWHADSGHSNQSPEEEDMLVDEPAEPINILAPQLGSGTGSDTESQPEVPVDRIKDASTVDHVTVPDFDEESNDVLLGYPDSGDELQLPRDKLSAKVKGKQRAIEPTSTQNDTEFASAFALDDEDISGGDDSLFDNDDDTSPLGDHNSMFGGESDISEERIVLPPVRPLKRSNEISEEDEVPPKRQKSASSGPSENDKMIIIDDSDEGLPWNMPGPSKPHGQTQPELQVHKKSKLQQLERVALRRWRKRMIALWEGRKTISPDELNQQMMEVLVEIFDQRWSLLLEDIANAKLVALLKRVCRHAVFEDTTRDKVKFIIDAFEQRFNGRSIFLWKEDKIIRNNPSIINKRRS